MLLFVVKVTKKETCSFCLLFGYFGGCDVLVALLLSEWLVVKHVTVTKIFRVKTVTLSLF